MFHLSVCIFLLTVTYFVRGFTSCYLDCLIPSTVSGTRTCKRQSRFTCHSLSSWLILFSFTPSHLALFVLIITTIVPWGNSCPEGRFKETKRPGPQDLLTPLKLPERLVRVTSHYHVLDSSAPSLWHAA